MNDVRRNLAVLLVLLFLAPVAFGQTTASLTGTVTTGRTTLPGVTVTVSSPALQGTRTTLTSEAGGYLFPSLPPGEYKVQFELPGMQPATQRVQLNLAQTSRADADLKFAAVAEAVTVTAAAPAVLETTQIATTFDAKTLDQLPVGRTIRAAVLLAPGVNEAGPNNQVVIHGAQSFDSLFLVNGVVVNENLRGQPHDAYIEDAVQETTILTGGISAEYGRFTGGVISTLTKSGGNEFSGSLRDSLANEDWTEKTPFVEQADAVDEINHTYAGTFGGRILRDRLWFFTAGRMEERTTAEQTRDTNVPFHRGREEERWELKLTGQLAENHSLVGSYTDRMLKDTHSWFGTVVDLRSLRNQQTPVTLLSVHYNGVLTNNLLVEALYSAMDHTFIGGGSMFRDRIFGTMILDIDDGRRAWSPTFCGVCRDKERDNRSYLAKGSYFLSTRSLGDHTIVAGVDDFHQLRTEDNYQSGSDFRLHGDFIYREQDVFLKMDARNPYRIEWNPVFAESSTSDFAVRSLFMNDKWELNDRLSFNLGLRYDESYGEDQAGNTTVDDAAFSPRLGVTYDFRGDGKHRFYGTAGRYVSKVDQGPADLTSIAGRPATITWNYRGPAINTGTGTLVSTEQVLAQVWAWFDSVGGTSNQNFIRSVSIPGLTLQFPGSVQAPSMDEYTVGYGFAIGSRGFLKADLIHRTWGDFYVVRRTLETGKATDPRVGSVDVGMVENADDYLEREYKGFEIQARYRLLNRLHAGGHYTWSELRGNIEGETATSATVLTDYNNYPQYTRFAQNQPVGFLNADMRHRSKLWVQYDLPLPVVNFNISLLQNYHSALPYDAAASIDVRKSSAFPGGIENPGYSIPPSSVGYFFSDRGEFRADDITATDLALNFELPIRDLSLFLNADVLNVFNEQGIEDPDAIRQTVFTHLSSSCLQANGQRCLPLNPFTETPVEGVHWVKHPNFGKPTSDLAYQLPRTYRFSVGLRF